jgi:phosphoglycolate phosphatase
MRTKLPKAIIFDWDNTLADTWPLIHSAINTTMKHMGKESWGLDKVKNDIHQSMRESFPLLFGDKWQEAGEIYKSSYKSQHLEKVQLLPGAIELINFAIKEGILLFIISNKIGNTLRAEVEHLNITNKFFVVIGSGDAKIDKPHKAPVDLALKGSNINPETDLVWFVGDTISDIDCAINSSCVPILYGEGNNVPKSLIASQSAKQDKQMLCFADHYEILAKLQGI